MKTMSRTSITSTIGVTLISRKAPRLLVYRAIVTLPSAPGAPSGPPDERDRRVCAGRLLRHQSRPFVRTGIELGQEIVHPALDPVVKEHRGNGRSQTDRRGDERFTNRRGDHRQARGLRRPNPDERVHDSVDGAEEPDERSARGY